jgi:MarR family transcriptional regulator, organic hydroperoxide resistance regulator
MEIDSRMPPEPSSNLPKMSFRTREQEAAVGLLRTTDAIRRHFSAIVAPFGITLQQYNVLRILRGAGRDGLATLAIAERMVEQTPGVTRLVDRLVKKGLVTRRPCEEDRRRVYCHITPAGLKVLASLDEPIAQGDAISVAPLTPADLDRLITMLDRIRAHNS